MPISVFDTIYKENRWKSQESRSGRGSELCNTENIRANLPNILRYIGAKSMLDASCGDFNWMKEIPLDDIQYYGCDIVQELIDQNNKLYTRPGRNFFQADITSDKLPSVDLILCRCTLYHLSYRNINKALTNMKKSAKYLLLTNMPKTTVNTDMVDGGYRKLNLHLLPFKLPAPMLFFWDAPSTNEVMELYRVKDMV
jgi:SAM-dependent methyltransferase